MLPIITPLVAASRQDDAFITDFFWRKNPVLERVENAIRENYCGDLRSLRFTWMRPRKRAGSPESFLFDTFSAALDGARLLAGAPLNGLYVKRATKSNLLFALAEFTNRVVAEFELNEALPDTMEDICFLKANFTAGHLTNQPLVGYENEEGMLWADDHRVRRLSADHPGMELAEGPIEHMKMRFRLAAEKGGVAAGPGEAAILIARIKEACR